jgi:hypothetical protein
MHKRIFKKKVLLLALHNEAIIPKKKGPTAQAFHGRKNRLNRTCQVPKGPMLKPPETSHTAEVVVVVIDAVNRDSPRGKTPNNSRI